MQKISIGIASMTSLCIFSCRYDPSCDWDHMIFYGHGGMGFMWILFVAIIVVIAFWAVRELRKKDTHPLADTPIDILKKRYAKGEITKEQFEQMKKDIGT